jgi:hypothetical protein
VIENQAGGPAPLAELMVFNPVHDSTTIAFILPLPGTVRLSIMSVRGALLATIVDGEYASGDYRARFDSSSLPPGVYICRLRTCRGATSKLLMKEA